MWKATCKVALELLCLNPSRDSHVWKAFVPSARPFQYLHTCDVMLKVRLLLTSCCDVDTGVWQDVWTAFSWS